MDSSGPLAGGHFQSLEGKNQRKDEPRGIFASYLLLLIVILILLFPPVARDHEHDQDQRGVGLEVGCALAVAHYNRSALRP